MAMNLASKYSKKVDERFKLKSLTEAGINKGYDWEGVKTISIYGVDIAPMNDYVRTGANRYGALHDLGNTKQEMTLTKDRGFNFVIDKGNYEESMMVMEAGKALARQIDEVIVPEVDSYRLAVMSAAAIAGGGTAVTAVTKTNAYELFLNANERLDENKVPVTGRIAFVTPKFYNFIKLDPTFMKATEIAQKALINGQVGEIDGVKIVKVPSSYFPANHAFILTHPSATVAAEKLEDYKTHQNPPGISGWLVEGRKYYDAFVLNNKNKALFAHRTA